jgi:hypothetical protein
MLFSQIISCKIRDASRFLPLRYSVSRNRKVLLQFTYFGCVFNLVSLLCYQGVGSGNPSDIRVWRVLYALFALGTHTHASISVIVIPRSVLMDSSEPGSRLVFILMGWGEVSELRPLAGLLLNSQMTYEYGDQRWNDTDRGKPKNSQENLSQRHTVY